MAALRGIPLPLNNLSRDELLTFIKLSNESEEYGDVLKGMVKLVCLNPPLELNVVQRRLLLKSATVTYTRLLRSYNTARRNEGGMRLNVNDPCLAFVRNHRFTIETMIRNHCLEIINFLVETLIPSASTLEQAAEYLRMKGVFYTFLNRLDACAAEDTFLHAEQIARNLPPADPVRLNIAMSYSAFAQFALHQPERAQTVVNEAMNAAIDHLYRQGEQPSPEVNEVITQLQENVMNWNDQVRQVPQVQLGGGAGQLGGGGHFGGGAVQVPNGAMQAPNGTMQAPNGAMQLPNDVAPCHGLEPLQDSCGT